MTCDSYIQGLKVRATRLDECGAVDAGPCGYVVSKGFVSVAVSENTTDSTEISQTLADGTRCYYVETQPLLNNLTVNIEFCQVDPELFELTTGSPLVLDDAVTPAAIGFTTDEATYASAHFALEVWTALAQGTCPVGTGRRWGYYLLPWLVQGTVSKPTFENGSVNFSVMGAKTKTPNQWGVGPYNIQLDSAGNPSPLFTPLSTTAHDLLSKVNVAPPTEVCGCQELIPVS